jgi:hypothetical protein
VRRLVIALCVLVLPACGVGSQEEPQLIEESTRSAPPGTPSFETRTSPPPSSPLPSGESPG